MEHGTLESCRDYLPKARRRHKAMIARCPRCHQYFVGDIGWGGEYRWSSINLGKKKNAK